MVKSRFRSRTFHIMDDKGRVNLPGRFRDVLRENGSEILMVAPWKSHLRAYPIAEWEAMETKLLLQGGEQNLSPLVRYIVGGVVECVLDKQGRIRLPPEIRDDVKITKEIALTGMLDWIEIWDKNAALADTDQTRDKFEDHQASLAKMGIL